MRRAHRMASAKQAPPRAASCEHESRPRSLDRRRNDAPVWAMEADGREGPVAPSHILGGSAVCLRVRRGTAGTYGVRDREPCRLTGAEAGAVCYVSGFLAALPRSLAGALGRLAL